MNANVVRAVWTEPAAPHPPVRLRRDWVLVTVFAGTAVLEGVLRQGVPLRPAVTIEAVALAFGLLWRRTHPLAVLAAGFGAAIVVDAVSLVLHTQGQVGLYTMVFMLLLPYALFRWGSGRHIVIGSAILLTGVVLGIVRDHTPLAESVAGFVVVSFPAALGLMVRFWGASRLRELDQVRFRERELLARELHDTVAHHVSAMVIRAQAGRVVADSRPGAAREALEIIEAEGSRTLAEMRTMVGALRGGAGADLAPVGGIDDLRRLARSGPDRPIVQVSIGDVPPGVSPSVEAALYRIAQESVTNALRHARHAGQVEVRLTGQDGRLHLTVSDDGEPVPASRALEGYGIVGMRERATLLGGTLEAGPASGQGWTVEAVLPQAGAA